MDQKRDRAAVEEALELLQSDGVVKSLMEHLPAIVHIELPGGPAGDVYVSPQVEQTFGFTQEEWLAIPNMWVERLHPDDRERAVAAAQHTSETGERFRMEYRMLAKDGRVVWIAEDDHCVFDDDGNQLYWQGVMMDVTAMKETESRLKWSEWQFQGLVEHIPAVLYVDPPGQDSESMYVSPQITEMLGVTPEDYLADPLYWRNHLHPDDREKAEADYDQFTRTGQPEASSYRMLKPDGQVVWVYDRAMTIRDDSGEVLMLQGVMFDVTDQKEAEQEVDFISHHDRLTGLPNRSMFEEMVSIALARARRSEEAVAVLLMDLDDFKLVNNSLGHAAGDEVLGQIAMRLREAVRDTDIIARQGGDEFLVLLADLEGDRSIPGPDMDAALMAAETAISSIQRALETPFSASGTEVYVTASTGVSIFPGTARDPHSLLKQADLAMYRSKKRGPGGHSVFSSEETDSTARLDFSTRLRKAVESRNWVLHYQPIVDLRDGRMTGVEGLIRWLDPTAGIIPPGDFIPLAEEMGLIESIGAWVVEEVCRQGAAWQREGFDLELGFNLSPRQLWQPNLVEMIFANVETSGVDPSRLVLEITEGTAMTEPEKTQRILWDLHGRGLHLAIDDFGTGYSSLARLKHLPVSTLKIDRAFVMDLPNDGDAASMATAIVQLAESLGMSPLAEGIETEEQWRFLVDQGCTYGQGYYFSRPVPAEEITAIARGRALRMADDVTSA